MGEIFKFCGNREEFVTSVEMGGNRPIYAMHHWLKEMDAPVPFSISASSLCSPSFPAKI